MFYFFPDFFLLFIKDLVVEAVFAYNPLIFCHFFLNLSNLVALDYIGVV